MQEKRITENFYKQELHISRDYSTAYCLPVLYDDVPQRLLFRLGLKGTGVMLNVLNMDRMTCSHHNGRNLKHSQGIQILAAEKRDVGMIHVPEEHKAYCRKIYDDLGVTCQLSPGFFKTEEPELCSVLYSRQDNEHSSLEIRIELIGKDLRQQIQQILTRYPLREKQTANILLNCSDPHAVWAYKILKSMGFFFAGLRPLCSNKEYMVLHNPGRVRIYFTDYMLSKEFAGLLTYVRSCYEELYGLSG